MKSLFILITALIKDSKANPIEIKEKSINQVWKFSIENTFLNTTIKAVTTRTLFESGCLIHIKYFKNRTVLRTSFAFGNLIVSKTKIKLPTSHLKKCIVKLNAGITA